MYSNFWYSLIVYIKVQNNSLKSRDCTGDFFEVWNKGYPPKSWKIECQVKHLKLPLFNVVQLTQFHVQWKLKLSFCYDFVELNKSGNFKCFTWHSIFHDFGGYPPFQTSKKLPVNNMQLANKVSFLLYFEKVGENVFSKYYSEIFWRNIPSFKNYDRNRAADWQLK